MKMGTGNIGRVGALAFALTASLASIVGCGDNGVTPPPDARAVDAPPPKPAVLSMAPAMNDFGSVLITQTSSAATFTVSNSGEATSGMITPVITGTNAADFTATNGCTTLAGGGTCIVTVTFHPTTAGTKSASLAVSGSPGGTVMAALLGVGNTPGTLTISPSSLSFTSVVAGATGTQQTFTVTNTGGVATTVLTTTKAGSDPGEFTKVMDTCNGQTLAAAATCTVAVNFAPSTAGAKAASFIVAASTGGSVTGAVTGTALAPANVTLNPTLQDFGSIAVGSSSANVTFTVSNSGGVATTALAQTITGDYSIVNGNCVGTILAPAATCNIIVRFTPTTTGALSGTLNVSATTGGSRNASLNGIGVQTGLLAISPTPFAFPNTTTGQTSTSQIFTVTNTGGSATGALGTALGGTNPSQFTIVPGSNGCQGVILAASATCTIAIVFSPQTGAAKTANLTVTANPGGQTVANISGTGIAPALFAIAPASRDYGSVVTNTQSAIQTFTVTNAGGQSSAVPVAAINGSNASEFMITSNSCNAALTPAPAAGSTCTVSVRFDPTTVGAKTASLDITGTPGGPISAALSGAGVAQAALAVNPSILTFPLTLIGNSSATQTFTVTNNGSQTTGVLAVTVVGANPGDYSQTNNCEDGAGPGVDTLIAGASCTVTVTFSPTARDARNASVQISGTPGGSVTVALNGTALPRLEILTPAPVTIPNNFDFGSSVVNPDTVTTTTVTVRNNTGAAVVVSNVETDTNNSFVPSAGCTGATVGANSTCVFTVGFSPQVLGVNNGSYLLTIPGTCPSGLATCNSAQQNVTGTGTVTTLVISDGDATPTAHNFGNTGVGTSSAVHTFTVTNAGKTTTGVLAVDLTGTGYQITTNNCSGVTLADNASCTIGVVFTPTATGAAMGTITVRTSQGAPVLGGMVQATLTGTGVTPNPIANPTSIDWGTLFAGDPVNTAATDKVIAISNPNDQSTTITLALVNSSTPAFSGVNNAANTCGTWVGSGLTATLGAGLSCNVVVRFTPALPVGSRTGGKLNVTQSIGNLQATVLFTAAVKSTISIVAAPVAFTNQVVNTTASQTIMVRNDSTQTVTGFAVNAGGAPYFILNNTCTTLTAGAMCSFDLQYSPTSAPATNSATLSVTATNGSAIAQVTGNAITAANVIVSPTVFAFGSEIAGQNGSTQVFTFTNIGQQTSGTFSAALAGANAADFSIQANTCGVTLAGNASCAVTVRFNPGSAGGKSATLAGSGTPGGSPTAALTGTGVAAGGLRVTPTAFTFADTTAGTTSANTTFTVQNTSAASTATLNLGVGTADFSIQSGGTCGATLAAGASCTVFVRFNPATAGSKADILTVQTATTFANVYGRGLTVANITSNVGGTFTNNTAVSRDDSFGSTSITIAGVTGTVSSLRLHINGYTDGCPVTSEFVLVAPGGARLRVMSSASGFSPFCTTINTPVDITFDDAATQQLPFGPSANSFGTGSYRPTDATSFGNTFSATAAAPEGTGTFANTVFGASVSGTWTLLSATGIAVSAGTTMGYAGWSLEVNNLDFGSQAIATTSGARTLTLTNNGQTAATALTGTLTGADATHFMVTDGCNGVALAPGASCNLVVAFKPTTTGTKTALLTYTGPVTIPVTMTGLGVNPALLSVTPSVPQTDGSRAIGKADAAVTTFTFTNSAGTVATSSLTFSLSNPANFTLSQANSTCALDGSQTLDAGAACTVGVFFNPTAKGALTTNVVATATAGGMVMGVLNGTGTEAIVAVTASPVAFTAAAPGAAGTTQTLTYQNVSDVSTSLLQTTLTNSAGSDFSILSDNCGGQSIAAGATCTIDVHFTPSGSTGARTAAVAVSGVVTGTATSATITVQSTVN